MKTKPAAALILALILILSPLFPTAAASDADISPLFADIPSAILIETKTGEILFEKDSRAHRAPASVTKIMTMLLAAEAVENGVVSLEDPVCASAKAASMGGSQIWLEEGEQMSFGEMLKCITVVSANDCCVAIAEHIAGSEEAFVKKMNERAIQLGLTDTNFLCCSGLSDSDDHYSSAYDLAVIARELLKHDFIKEYTTIWIDSIREGKFGLSNTNKLIYHYQGATGLKTGFTSKAMHCLAASAERDGVEYIAVVLGAPSSSARFESAKALLNYAFANYTLAEISSLCALPSIPVSLGERDCINISPEGNGYILVKKDEIANLNCSINIPAKVTAPIEQGQQLGSLLVSSSNGIIKEIPLLASESVAETNILKLYLEILGSL